MQGKALLPVKSPDVLKRVVYVDVMKNIQAEDYPGIHDEIREHYDRRLNLAVSLDELRGELRDCKKAIREEDKEVSRLNAMIATGEMELKARPVIETWDYGVGSIASEIADESVRAAAEIPMREMLSFEKQRSLSFKTPHEDCYNCKYVKCRADGRGCQNFADCYDCPDFSCGAVLYDYVDDVCCGFGKRLRNEQIVTRPFGTVEDMGVAIDEARRGDCYFCQNVCCDADLAAVCDRQSDCAECGSASCSNKISGTECSLGKTCGMPF